MGVLRAGKSHSKSHTRPCLTSVCVWGCAYWYRLPVHGSPHSAAASSAAPPVVPYARRYASLTRSRRCGYVFSADRMQRL
jgi:hypothetical protein